MRKNVFIYLVLIALVAIFIRLIPTFGNYGWGNDFGIYYTILQDYVRKGSVMTTYPSPWGGAGYGDFPVMYITIFSLSSMTGISVRELLMTVPQILGGLTVVLIFYIAEYLTKDLRIALLSAFLLAVDPIQAFQTSMSSILVFGHFFGLLTVLFAIKYIDRKIYIFPFFVSSALLIMSHELSTFMYLIGTVGIFLFYKIKYDDNKPLKFLLPLYIFSIAMFSYWYLVASKTILFISNGFLGIPAWFIIPAYFALLTLLFTVPSMNIKNILNYILDRTIYLHERKPINVKTAVIVTSIIAGTALAITPFYSRFMSYASILVFLPLVGIAELIGIGFVFLSRKKYSTFLLGWIISLSIFLFYSIITRNSALLPGRFFEYLVEPMSIVEAIGVLGLLESYNIIDTSWDSASKKSKDKKWWKGGIHYWKSTNHSFREERRRFVVYLRSHSSSRYKLNIVLPAILILVILSSASTVYTVGNTVTPSHNQSISMNDYAAANWTVLHVNKNFSVATDHTIGILVEGMNESSSFEYTRYLWNSTNYSLIVPELLGKYYNTSLNYTPNMFVLIDSSMLSGGVWGYNGLNNPSEPPIYINNASFTKFFSSYFNPVYLNFTSRTKWSIVFEVNWTAIDIHFLEPKYYVHMPRSCPRIILSSYILNAMYSNIPLKYQKITA